MLFQPADNPSVLVQIDDELMSVCTGNCNYHYLEDKPEITGMSLSGTNLNIQITLPANVDLGISVADFQVSLIQTGASCQIDASSSSISNIVCALPTNNDGSIHL